MISQRIVRYLVLLVLSLALFVPQHAEAKRLVRAAVYNYKPLIYSAPDGSAQGFFVKMLDRIAEQEGWQMQYLPGTWQEGLDRLRHQEIDLLICVGYTPERASFLDFPKEFLILDWGAVYRSKASRINTIMDLEGKTVCGLKGSVYTAGFLDLARQFQLKVKLLEVNQVSEVFKAVESGRADAGVTSNIPGILNEDAHLVERTPIIFSPVKLGFAVGKGENADLIEALNRDIELMKNDPGSLYNHELGHLFGKPEGGLSREAIWILSGISGGLVVCIVFIVVLRRQVRAKTRELDEQGSLMRSIINGTTDAVFIKDVEGRYIVVNDEVVRLFNLQRGEILGHDDASFFPPEEAQLLRANDIEFMQGHRVATTVEQITTLGRSRVYLATKGPIYDKDGKVSGIFGISRDITDLKQAELEVHRYSQLLKRTGEMALVGGWELDLTTGALYWSEMLRQIHDLAPDAPVTPESSLNFCAPEARPVVEAAAFELIGSGTPFDLEIPIVTARGRRIWGRVQGEAEWADGRVVKLFGSTQDITERKQMEEQLRQSNEQLRFVLDGSQLGFWDWNMETGEVARNERWAEMLGYTLEEVQFTVDQWTTLIHPDDEGRAWTTIDAHLTGRIPRYEVEYRMLAKDGSYKWILDRARIVKRAADGAPLRMSGTHTDITERKRAEEETRTREQQMQHVQRLESLGVLTGGIAHDFNNILAIIIGHCSLARLGSHSTERSIAEIERAAERAAELCRQMLAYAGKSQFVCEEVDFAALVRDMVQMLTQTISRKILIRQELAPELPIVQGDPSQLRQIAMNLLINASEAIGGEQGEIRVRLDRVAFGEGLSEQDHLGRAIPPGAYLRLEVADTGCGMDEETMIRLFEPFYTTKFTGRGLGMSAVLGIITSHQGALQLESAMGGGTSFRIFLPVADEACGRPAAQGGLEPHWQGSGTVLLVEDESQVRHVARALLEKIGFRVLEAEHGKAALELYQEHAGEVRLVLSDLGMPEMDGEDLVFELKRAGSRVPVLIASGFGDAEVATRLGPGDIAGMISKPYNTDQLRAALKRALEAES
ncbi:hypothetical protein GMLC_10860 [Geomonas limicola]|uniref:histidine kinase n=1 Tax=Geomonas limicola TaxID=2740186 RepID=A0A6V8N6P9_9BACT|nr:PAS domain S-box protein [Geomonas limicola]GFO67507.1 hypothetical protein GMLC_10860 [Geomonas limicola]